MSSRDDQFSAKLRNAIWECALLSKRLLDIRKYHNQHDIELEEIDSVTRRYEEINYTLVALDDSYTTSIDEIYGHNIQLLAHLLCYTGDDKAAAETILIIGEKYHALRQQCHATLDVLLDQLLWYTTTVNDLTFLDR
ncbi:hypothetical protein ACHAQK_003727 [Fusarium lateritium]